MHNRFGLFIHWGIYAQLGLQEQAFARYDMERGAYEALKDVFNPTEYDPDAWVSLAKSAGMSYICFTAKHHDGFCMWDTRTSDYSIMHTPYGKDVLRELADACSRQDIRLSIYYSCPDWHYEYGYNPNASHQWKARRDVEPDTLKLRSYIREQITELMSAYGHIYTLFWDIPPKINDPSLNALVRRLQPGIYINDRGFDEGDFSTPERDFSQLPGQRFTCMTEACNSVGQQSWGYREGEDFHTTRYLLTSIDRIMAMGGSYLLNVGPDARGVITRDYADSLRKLGDWYNRMEGCLEDTEPESFAFEGLPPCILNRKNGKSYFHFYHGIPSSGLVMRTFPTAPKTIRLLNSGKELPWKIEYLPSLFCYGEPPAQALHIHSIPAEEYDCEPLVLEILWS